MSRLDLFQKISNTNNQEAQKTVEDMQRLGVLVDSISGALYSPADNALGTVSNTLSPAIVYEIGQYFKENEELNKLDNGDRPGEGSAAHILAQTLVAATASLAGNDELTAGLSAGGAEVIAPILADWMYDKETKDLTSEEKNTISAIISLGSATVGATTGDTTDVISSSVAGTTAVEDNGFFIPVAYEALVATGTRVVVVNILREGGIAALKAAIATGAITLTASELNSIADKLGITPAALADKLKSDSTDTQVSDNDNVTIPSGSTFNPKPPDDEDKLPSDAKKMTDREIGEDFFGDKNWHKTNAKQQLIRQYSKELKGSTNADFYKDKAGNFYLRGNKPPYATVRIK